MKQKNHYGDCDIGLISGGTDSHGTQVRQPFVEPGVTSFEILISCGEPVTKRNKS